MSSCLQLLLGIGGCTPQARKFLTGKPTVLSGCDEHKRPSSLHAGLYKATPHRSTWGVLTLLSVASCSTPVRPGRSGPGNGWACITCSRAQRSSSDWQGQPRFRRPTKLHGTMWDCMGVSSLNMAVATDYAGSFRENGICFSPALSTLDGAGQC